MAIWLTSDFRNKYLKILLLIIEFDCPALKKILDLLLYEVSVYSLEYIGYTACLFNLFSFKDYSNGQHQYKPTT